MKHKIWVRYTMYMDTKPSRGNPTKIERDMDIEVKSLDSWQEELKEIVAAFGDDFWRYELYSILAVAFYPRE